jgi:hypothetical protein
MFKDGSGNSTYLGSPQCTKHNANQVVYGDLVKNRPNYGQYPINNLMVMKYSATTGFMNCMNGFTIGFTQCPNLPPVNASCIQQNNCGSNTTCTTYCGVSPGLYNTCAQFGTNFMTQACNTFINSQGYISVNF